MGSIEMTMHGKPISMTSVRKSIRKRTGANSSTLSDQRLDAAVKKEVQEIMDENRIVKKRVAAYRWHIV
jgi:protoporphyrinogen oxidase